MSKTTLIACIAVATALTAPTFAVTPASRDAGGINFEWVAEDFSGFHLALFGGRSTREMKSKNKIRREVDVDRYNAIIGYDLTRWLTLYGVAGVAKAKDELAFDSDTSGIFGVGVWANLIEVDQLSLLSTITKYRLSSGAEITYAGFDDFNWMQFDAFLTFELVNELTRASFIFPEAVSVFAGPILSVVESDNLTQSSSNIIGLTVGISIMFTDNVYATGGADVFSDDNAYFGMVGVRF